ncbi:hypothetical protein [Nitrosospira sp. Nsp14]|nr:hypothetical protein [Nitrosospira sp. Nsp14]
MRSEHVVAALNGLAVHPILFVDNGSEFSGQLLDPARKANGH